MKLKVIIAIVRIGASMLWERISGMRPKAPPAIPPSFETITPEWLTAVLCGRCAGAEVMSISLVSGSEGTTSRKLIQITYNEIGTRAKLPSSLFGKATANFTSRMTVGVSGIGLSEVNFFNTIRPSLDIEAPISYFAGIESPSQRSLILLKATPENTYTNPGIYITRGQAEDMVSLLAILHGTFWNSPHLEQEFSWLRSALEYQTFINGVLDFPALCEAGNDLASSVIPQKMLARRSEIWPAAMRAVELNVEGPQTLLHNDVHIGNWYRTPVGHMGLCDWQCIVKGNWASDFGYAISSALTVEDRRAWEKDLLRLYLEKLAASGVQDVPNFDAAFLLYRQQLFHALIYWTFTIGGNSKSLRPAEMQPHRFCLMNIERFSNAIVDLDSLDSLH